MRPLERGRPDTPRSSRARAAVVGLLVVVIGCLPTTEVADPEVARPLPYLPAVSPAEEHGGKGAAPTEEAAVVLVVFDGVRWQDVFQGADRNLAAAAHVEASSCEALMPHLHALIEERGAALGAPGYGDPITASGPNFVSLPGYTEIFTGHRWHPCADNDCPPARTPTVFDEMRASVDRPQDIAVFASWDRIERAATADEGKLVLSTGRSRLSNESALRDDEMTSRFLDEGRQSAPFPGHGDFRPDRLTAALALGYLEAKRPRLMFLGLGEPDEYAHRGDYGGYLEALRAADRALGDLFGALDRMRLRGRRTTVFVTADHGRARDYRFHGQSFPESSRVWLVAAGGDVSARGLIRAERHHRLADIAPTVRLLLGLPEDGGSARGAPIEELFGSPPWVTAGLQ